MRETTAPARAAAGPGRHRYHPPPPARRKGTQVHWLNTGSDELLASLRVLDGHDVDLAGDQTRLISRLRDCLTAIAPALRPAGRTGADPSRQGRRAAMLTGHS
jgi:hypothetical protein